MLYNIFLWLTPFVGAFNVVNYISFRALAGLLTSFVLSVWFGHLFITQSSKKLQAGVREYTPDTHRTKGATPTMGGIFILLSGIVSAMLWCNMRDPKLIVFFSLVLGFGLIGFWDDWCKIRYRKGISEKQKSLAQLIIAFIGVSVLVFFAGLNTVVVVPFFKNLTINLGWLFIPWAVWVIVGTSNSVNLTDGLDGLAISSLIPNYITFSFIAYLAGSLFLSSYLYIPYAHTAELSIVAAIFAGTSIGFLWYNTHPAQVFMGDVGSLSLGAALALMALLTKQELLLPISGIVFVVETLSVMVQVLWFKRYRTRIFKMTPLHHHFELSGLAETKIVTRATIITLMACLFALITLKIR